MELHTVGQASDPGIWRGYREAEKVNIGIANDRFEMKAYLENVFHTIRDGIFVVDLDLTVVWMNRWIETTFASRMPLVGKKCYEAFWDRKDPCEKCPGAGTIETGLPKTQVTAYPSGNHPSQWFEISMFRLEDAEGNVIGTTHQIKDITERKKVEGLLRDEIAQRRMLVEQSRDGIVVLDSNGKVFEANKHYADMLGYTLEEVRELYVWGWDTQWSREELLEMIRTVDDTGDHFETRHRRKDGSYYDVEISTNGTVYRN